MKIRTLFGLGFLLLVLSCQLNSSSNNKHNQPKKITKISSEPIVTLNNILAQAIIQDGFTPPVASRVYTYPNIAAYEALRFIDKNYQSFANELNGLKPIHYSLETKEISPMIVVSTSFSEVAKELVYSPHIIDNGRDSLARYYERNNNQKIIEHSKKLGRKVAKHIINWMKTDGYSTTRNMPKYQIDEDDSSSWKPTPPTYGEAIEPHWDKLRPFILDSADQFAPPPPPKFCTDTSSKFYKDAYNVYKTGKNLNDSLYTIAKFWDCNPMTTTQVGHMTYVKRQLTPGGHWIKITQNACTKSGLNLIEASEALVIVAVTVADAFISSWDAKYRSDLVRPGTYIRKYIDKNWEPVLETPLFPEYTSAHSVVSFASAKVLTKIFGKNYSYVDDAEEFIGLEPKKFKSFKEAAKMAAISRLYGGIHYMPAIKHGKKQGTRIGNWVWKQINQNHKLLSQQDYSR